MDEFVCLAVTMVDLRQINVWAPEPSSSPGPGWIGGWGGGGALPVFQRGPCPCRGHPLVLPHGPEPRTLQPREVKIDGCQDEKGGLKACGPYTVE